MIATLPKTIKHDSAGKYLHFLVQGFVDAFGATICFQAGHPVRPAPLNITAVDINKGGETKRVWWDWSDFWRRKDDGLEEPCGKIELRKQDATDLRKPTAQVTPSELLDNLSELRKAKTNKREWDVYCVVSATNFEDRVSCLRAIRAEKEWYSFTRMTPRPNRPSVPVDLLGNRLDPFENYRNQINSRICIAPRGMGEKTCRHMETLALGVCLISAESDCVWPGDPEGCFVTVNRDWSDLGEKVGYLLSHEKEREEIAKRGQAYWNNHLSPQALARQLCNIADGGVA